MAENERPLCVSYSVYQNDMRRLLEKGDYADITLICKDGTTFKAHKPILCAHSEFFFKAFQSDKYLEGNTGKVNLEIGDSDVIAQLLNYLYTSEYDSTAVETEAAWMDAKLYAAADFYMITSLKEASQAKFQQSATKLCSTSISTKGIGEFPAIVSFIYENTADEGGSGLRDTAIKVIISLSSTFFVSVEGRKCLRNIMDDSGAFGRDLGIALLTKWEGFRKVQCQQCRHIWADPRPRIPDIRCPGCEDPKLGWDKFPVE